MRKLSEYWPIDYKTKNNKFNSKLINFVYTGTFVTKQ